MDGGDIVLVQLLGGRGAGVPEVGKYYPGTTVPGSPVFESLRAADALKCLQEVHGDALAMVVNGAFFEDHDTSTRLAFPVKSEGQVVTGGSSPYGPDPDHAHPHYTTVSMYLLGWNQGGCAIEPYDYRSGDPLASKRFSDGVVTYRYEDHPARLLAPDRKTRFHLIAVNRQKNGPQQVIFYSGFGTIDEVAGRARAFGAEDPILTLDGGSSCFVWTQTSGAVILPGSFEQDGKLEEVRPPHYLGVVRRPGATSKP